MRSEIEYRVRDELTGAVESRLAAAHGFDEFCFSACAQVGLVRWRYGPDLAPAAGVDGVEFGGYDVWLGGGDEWGGFGGEEVGDEACLEGGGSGVGDYGWEMGVY